MLLKDFKCTWLSSNIWLSSDMQPRLSLAFAWPFVYVNKVLTIDICQLIQWVAHPVDLEGPKHEGDVHKLDNDFVVGFILVFCQEVGLQQSKVQLVYVLARLVSWELLHLKQPSSFYMLLWSAMFCTIRTIFHFPVYSRMRIQL